MVHAAAGGKHTAVVTVPGRSPGGDGGEGVREWPEGAAGKEEGVVRLLGGGLMWPGKAQGVAVDEGGGMQGDGAHG